MKITKTELKAWMAEELDEKIKAALQPYEGAVTELRTAQTNFMERMNRSHEIVDAEKPAAKKGLRAARIIRASAAVKSDDPSRIAYHLENSFDDKELAKEVLETHKKGLTMGNLGVGGALVPPGDVQELIDLLYPRSVIRSAGATVVPMPNGTLPWPKVLSGASAEYVGEAATSNATGLTTGFLNLSWKKLRAIVPLSQELARMSSPSADVVVRNNLVNALAGREDRAYIRDNGVGVVPKGLKYWALTGQTTDSAAADDQSVATITEVETDLRFCKNALEAADVPMLRPGWLMSPRSATFLEFMRDATGFKAFPEMSLSPRRLLGIPVFVTNNVPSNIAGNGADTLSELYLVDFADAVIGESNVLEVSVSEEASYLDDGGNVQSAFVLDQVLIKAIMRHDFGIQHEASIALINKINYGAH